MPYRTTIMGGWEECFTSAEIEGDGGYVGRIFERATGWSVELNNPEMLRDPAFVEALLEAKSTLLHYVNRTGVGAPQSTPAGISLWLMQRDDGKGFFTMGKDKPT